MAQTDRIGPVFFFDQPTRRSRVKGTRSYILDFREPSWRQLEAATCSHQKEGQECESQDSDRQDLSGEPGEGDELDASPCPGAASSRRHPVDAYKRAAPRLLDELARLLSRHRWSEVGAVPHGIVNILNESWDELTVGASPRSTSPPPTADRPESKGALGAERTTPLQAGDRAETGEREPRAGGDEGPSEWKAYDGARVKKCKQNSSRGGLLRLERPPDDDEPPSIRECQWAVERLQAARKPESEPDLSRPPVLRHYGEAKVKLVERRRKLKPGTSADAALQILEEKLRDGVQQKLHYGINDGSSCVYYPSGCMAVCQSRSGLPGGGFYTNVFSDGECPTVLATVTASGHGAVTHPRSSAIAAVWDQEGGFKYDERGNTTEAWSWRTCRTLRNKIVVKVSDQICVTLLSGASASLSFRCGNERVRLPLSPASDSSRPRETVSSRGRPSRERPLFVQAEKTLTSDPRLLQEKRSPVGGVSERIVTWRQTAVERVFREVEAPVEPSVRRRGHGGGELRRLRQRIRNTTEDWLDSYRVAIGIGCPGTERTARWRRGAPQEAALPSLNPPAPTDAKPEVSRRDECQKPRRCLSAPAEGPPDLLVQTPRTPKKRFKTQPPPVIRVGPVQIHGYVDPESVTLPSDPCSDASLVPAGPAPLAPSVPLTVCPALLRAALQGEAPRRRCCCSATLMPVVTDLEYDALVRGQPPHSRQILVVCVTAPRQPVEARDAVEDLYRRRNKHRTMPCSQCQMDSFRLVRYEMLPARLGFCSEDALLQQRHAAAPGMVLMYIRGTLLSVGYISSDASCSVWDLQRQISRSRRDYRLGLSLPSDYRFSRTVKNPAAAEATQTAGDGLKPTVSEGETEQI
ncbi:uncharacterized protein LOC108229962 isoform X2 [Kryptolebias marmoratus]|uniref:uncharacterized protein LOC108229962 isoform X2 n=1 Tax=Kryptolebias marmoratus TaxID=37003 RepID=UPI000D52FF25|nr:uncharacterized protein LOC108229962 isoform X2 [Kryptolebias marmoratus]